MTIYPAVFLLSSSSIIFEILLVRIFSISQWNHLAFMVISMALFGFAASGTLLSMRVNGGRLICTGRGNPHIRLYVLLYSVTALASFLILNRLPLDYLMLPVAPRQILFLLMACLLIAIPFFFTGMVLSSAYMLMPKKSGIIYFLNMAGSGIGALIPLTLLPKMNAGNLIAFTAILPLLATIQLYRGPKKWSREAGYTIAGILAAVMVLVMLSTTPELFRINPSPYKSLSQLLLFPDVTAAQEQTGLRGRVETVDSPYVRFAPGLSLKFQGSLPRQKAAFNDGDNRLVLQVSSARSDFVYQRHTLAYAGYLLTERLRNVLIVQDSGGSAITCALAANAENLHVLEKNPKFSDLLKNHYRIPVASENPRSFIGSSPDRFDVIHVESWGASLPGASALTQDYLFTIDALKLYLSRLTEGGVIIVSRRLLLPPANTLRLCAAAIEALRSLNAVPPEHCIAIIRNGKTFTMIISLRPFRNLEALSMYAEKQNFDLVWPQVADSPSLNRFNAFEKPFHYLQIRNLFKAYGSGTQKRFFDRYPLDIAPQTDDRPFPDKFFKWRKAVKAHKIMGSQLYRLLLSGEVVVLVVLVVALLTAFSLLCIPRVAAGPITESISVNHTVYFLAIGAGFILVELFFIHHYTLVFGDPVVSFAVVLSSLLVSSGAGGLLSSHLRPERIRTVVLLLITVLFTMCISANQTLHRIILLPAPYSQCMAIALLMPAGLLLGMPFPMGMRFLLHQPRQRAYAWALNGCASIVSSVAAVQIAISSGLKLILWTALAVYGLAWLTSRFHHGD
ncbi:MAG: hypothetical protein JRI93_01765 [Deltaproteobacteria bacterium]|nr:hypothetical protein [Deltaproteobacteria bacterium]